MRNQNSKILLVGCGAMGSALKNGWEKHLSLDLTIIDPQLKVAYPSLDELLKEIPGYQPDVIVFAIKPQILKEQLSPYQRILTPQSLFISIAAGISLQIYETHLAPHQPIIRAMPNIAATVGESMTVLVTSHPLSTNHKSMAESLFQSVGKFFWQDDESLMNQVTAVSGSGPAYFFRLVESLAQAAEREGLSAIQAQVLARQTFIGSAKLLANDPLSPAQWRERVTSPGGTTAAALAVLNQDDALDHLMLSAVQAAVQRGKDLNK